MEQSTERRLNEMLDAQSLQIHDLQLRLDKAKRELTYSSLWTRHTHLQNSEMDLPVPRIELSAEDDHIGLTSISAHIALSKYLHTDVEIIKIPMSYSSSSAPFDKEINDSKGIRHFFSGRSVTAMAVGQSEKMNLPLICRYNGRVIEGVKWGDV